VKQLNSLTPKINQRKEFLYKIHFPKNMAKVLAFFVDKQLPTKIIMSLVLEKWTIFLAKSAPIPKNVATLTPG
jgi:hypothetical protein